MPGCVLSAQRKKSMIQSPCSQAPQSVWGKLSSKYNYSATWTQDSRVPRLVWECTENYENRIRQGSAGPGMLEMVLLGT